MIDAYICDGVRTPIGRYGGALSTVRTDDLAALPLKALKARHHGLDWGILDDIVYGCANQAGEDNRNVARMAGLLAGLPIEVPATTVNKLCGSGLEALAQVARGIKSGEASLAIAGGVESMSRAPFVMGKATAAFSRSAEIFDTTIGWRFINPAMRATFGVDSMPETAENLAAEFQISRRDQDAFALRSQERALQAQQDQLFDDEIIPVELPTARDEKSYVTRDEHPRATSMEALGRLPAPFREGGSVTAGNASGVNDGAAALLVASGDACARYGLTPLARIMGAASAGVPPRLMGIGPVPAVRKLLERLDMTIDAFDTIELNEAFSAQALAVLRQLGLPDDAAKVNRQGGAIALGHPLGMSGVRLALTATRQLHRYAGRYALCTMCIGVGQGIALALERC